MKKKAIANKIIAFLLSISMLLSMGNGVAAASKESAVTDTDSEITKEVQSLYNLLKEEGILSLEDSSENVYVEKIKEQIPDWKQEIVEYFDNIQPNLKNSITTLEEELAILKAEPEEKKDTEKIKEIEEKIAALEKKIDFIDQKMEELSATLDDMNQTVTNIEDFDFSDINSLAQQAKSMVESVGRMLETAIDILAELDGAMEDMNDIVNGILDDIKAMDEEKLGEPIEKARPRLNQAMTELDAAAKEGSESVGKLMLQNMKKLAQTLKEDATTGVYTLTENARYLSIGDASVTGFGLEAYDDEEENNGYKDKIEGTFSYEYAKSLGIDVEKQYEQIGISGLRAEDILYLLDETFLLDEYGEKVIAPKLKEIGLEDLRRSYREEIENADLISMGFGFNEITEYVAAQLKGYIKSTKQEKPYEIDWSRYVDEETEAKIQDVLARLKEELKNNGMGTINIYLRELDIADIASVAIESYVYAYVSFALNYSKILNTIHEWNPEAQVLLIGMYNPMEGISLDMDSSVMPVGEYIEYVIQLTNMFFTSYAVLIPNTTYVEASDVSFDMDTTEPLSITSFITQILFGKCKKLQANEEGHLYIKEQIENAISIHTHDYSTAWSYDGTMHWHECTCGLHKDDTVHSYTDDKDTTCEVCGYKRTVNAEPVKPENPEQETIAEPKSVILSKTVYTYSGETFKPDVTVKDEKEQVISSDYYTVTYANNKNAGTAKATVTFKGKYKSFKSKSVNFTINKATYKTVTIKDMVYTGKKVTKITLLTSAGKTLPSTDYKIVSGTFKNNKQIGTATVKIKFKGNNIKSATKTLKFKIIPKSTSSSKLKKGKKQIKVTFKKVKNISGYQIQVSTSKKFTGKTTKTVKVAKSKASYTIKKLSAKKTYYVRVRTYKKSGKNYYSSWSKIKSIKTN